MRRRERAAHVHHPRRQRAAAGPAARPTTQNARLMPRTARERTRIKSPSARAPRPSSRAPAAAARRARTPARRPPARVAPQARRRDAESARAPLHRLGQHLLAVDAAPARRAALRRDVLDGRRRAERLVQVIDVADLGRPRIRLPDALGIGDRRPQLRPDRFRRLEQPDRVAHRLRHLRLAVEPHDAARRREQRLGLGEERLALFGAVLRRRPVSRPNSAFHRRATTRDSSRCCTWSSPTGTMSAR